MFGMSITQSDGSLWMSPEFTPQNLINKGTMSTSKGSVFQTSIPSNKSCFFFIKSSNKANMMFIHEHSNGYNALRLHQVNGSPGTITVYAFSDMVLPHSGYGIGFAPIFPDTCYHLTHYWLAAVDIPVASDNPVHYADAIRYNARMPLQGSLLPLTRLVWA